MNLYEDMQLDALGRQAHGHITAGDKAKEKAEQQYLAAGLYLAAAKARVQRTKGLTWPRFLMDHCNVGVSRANEVIQIGSGEKTNDEIKEARRERQNDANAKKRQRKDEKSPSIDGQSDEKQQQDQGPTSGADAVDEARTSPNPANEVMARIVARLKRMSFDDLTYVEKSLTATFGE